MGRSHVVTATTAGAWLAAGAAALGVPDELALLVIPVTAYAGLLPDLDHPRSTATYSVGPLTMALSWALRQFVEHRGPTHTPRGALAFGLALGVPTVALPAPLGGWAAGLWALAITVGCLTHIWADARTLSGVPGRQGRRRIGVPFRTGSVEEQHLLRAVYSPVAVGSTIGALALIGGAT
jgi:membrane-bound metal-dependent hydrolase YbcI (DUF457 family)